MQIDRRDCLAGVAATAAAAMLPALPARAIMSGGRFYFTDGPFSTLTPWSPAVDDALCSLWQFDRNDRLWLIRHIVTGLMCRRAPQEYDGFAVQAVSLDVSAEAWRPLVIEPWPDAATLAAIGRAAHCVAFAAFLKRAGWPAHRRAIFLRYAQTDAAATRHVHIEDAPALSPGPTRETT
jgi:hypothetical protein